jgi:hypothetical protein
MLLGCRLLPIINESIASANKIVADQSWCYYTLLPPGELSRAKIAVKGWGNRQVHSLVYSL